MKDLFDKNKDNIYKTTKNYKKVSSLILDEFDDICFCEDLKEFIYLEKGANKYEKASMKAIKNIIGRFLDDKLGNFDPILIGKNAEYLNGIIWKKKNITEKGYVRFLNAIINTHQKDEEAKFGFKEAILNEKKAYLSNIIPHNLITKEEYTKRTKEREAINTIYKTWFGKSWKKDKTFIHRIVGGMISKNPFFQRILVFIGSGGEGKSECIERIIKLIGVGNVSNESFDNLQEKFSIINLFQKLLNVDPDTQMKLYNKAAIIKKLATREIMRGEKKGGDTIPFENYAYNILSTNSMIRIYEHPLSRAIRRRMMFLKFDNGEVIKKLDYEAKKKFNRDKNDKRIFETEIYEILQEYNTNRKLLNNGTISGSHIECYHEFVEENNSVLRWFLEYWEDNPDYTLDLKGYYNTYKEWCVEEEEKTIRKKHFLIRLKELLKERKKSLKINKKGNWISLTNENVEEEY